MGLAASFNGTQPFWGFSFWGFRPTLKIKISVNLNSAQAFGCRILPPIQASESAGNRIYSRIPCVSMYMCAVFVDSVYIHI